MEGWEAIRGLDEEENWAERNRVLSKKDHFQLMESAREIVNDLVQNLPISSPSKPDSTSYGLTDDDFKYSAAQFDMDYLEGISSEANADPSALSRKSLFVKFDPLISTSPTRDRVLLGDNTHLSNIASTEGDLLILTTPPSHSAPRSVNHVDRPTESSDTAPLANHQPPATAALIDCFSSPQSSAGTSSQLHSSPPISSPSNSNSTHQSSHTPDHTPSSTRSPDAAVSISDHTHESIPHSGSAPDQAPSSQLTDNLVEVLKYSEHNLPEILEEARRQQRDVETAKYEAELKALKERIEHARKQALQQHKRKGHLQSKTIHVLGAINSTEEQINTLKEKAAHHTEKENELYKKHEEFKKQFGELDEQYELVSKDSASLENSFDELHKHYLRLKAIHHKLTEGNKILNQHMAELRMWNTEDMEYCNTLQQELQDMEMGAEEKFASMREKQESMLTVEKSRNQVLKVQHQNLQETYKTKVVERDEAAKLCNELMKVHENKTSYNIQDT